MTKDYESDRIHKEITVCDTHCDTIGRVLSEGFDLGTRSDKGHVDIPRLIEGGVDAQVFACWSGRSGERDGHYVKHVSRMVDALHLQLDKNSSSMNLALTARDVQVPPLSDRRCTSHFVPGDVVRAVILTTGAWS